MGMLFVSKEARGRGIGSLITCNLAEQRFKDGHSAVVTVEVWNEPLVIEGRVCMLSQLISYNIV